MSDSGEVWQVARRRKGAGRRGKRPVTCKSQDPWVIDTDKTIQRVRETMSELRCSDFWPKWKEQLTDIVSTNHPRPAEEAEDQHKEAAVVPDSQEECHRDNGASLELGCVCYGLGSFSSCVSARYQLAMLLLLLDTLRIPVQECCVYDPVFSSGEREVLKDLGLSVLTENEEGKRLVTRPTLFYLMHCGKALYNNLLWKNWCRETLPLLIIIGNSFSGIQDRMIDRDFQRDYCYIAQAVGTLKEWTLPCPSRLLDVFNDTALITFPPSSLQKLPESTWVEPPEPQYQECLDLEIILKEDQAKLKGENVDNTKQTI